MSKFITYQQAAATYQVSVLTIFKAVQDYGITKKAKRGVLYLDADQLYQGKLKPLKGIIAEALYWK